MEEDLKRLLELASTLNRHVGVKQRDGAAHLTIGPALALQSGEIMALANELKQADLIDWLADRLPDRTLRDELTKLLDRLPASLLALSSAVEAAPSGSSRVGKKGAVRIETKGEGAYADELLAAAREVKDLSRLCRRLQRELEPRLAEHLAVNILGIGEITTTIEIKGAHWRKLHPTEKRLMKLAYKRMPAFPDQAGRDHYIRTHNEYQELLESLGIPTPWHDNLSYQRPDGRWVVYNRQERLPTRQVACLIIQDLDVEGCLTLTQLLLNKMAPLFQHNLEHPETQIGFDGQIPNWVLTDYDHNLPTVSLQDPAVYIDTSTPLLRYNGEEQLDTELFLMSVPALFRPLLRWTVLQGILDRYYLPREVILDLVASFITHGRPDLVEPAVELANDFMRNSDFARDAEPLTAKAIVSYNREDVAIWHVFRTMKRIDRWLGERLFGKTYEQRLPHGSPKTWRNLVGAGGRGLSPED